ncbi:LysR family transcriptional regulator [Mesorhizobium sp. XAP10]|uniref:LysR family transcriptional regulator n=1 Tax=unclassified Mesorhizobium TaxID=325217 RepID=UPI0023DF557A|nr:MULTISPECIES: LysR family transcriptional regulator [unclassified Mesorhizobium]MDF3154543.1 LysR family transcriptional regulator [Mesorhizobium sp. XAP10]MDF3247907.1 LysR family transcriptional regulator [Mesorhizobium sp. XAP4]
MTITLAQIKAFERIARLGSFHAAARQLNRTQPSVSERIRELEDSLGVQLFVRRGPKISLTAQGARLLGFADQLLGAADQLIGHFKTNTPLEGIVRFGAHESFCLICLTDLIQRLNELYPNLTALVRVGDTATISQLLNDQQLDLAVVTEPEVSDDVVRETIGVNQFGWFVSASLDLGFGLGAVSPTMLCPHHLIISPPPARIYAMAMRWFAQVGAVPQHLSMCNSVSVSKLTILRGVAVGLLPVRVMEEELARGLVTQVMTIPPVPGPKVWLCHQPHQFGPNIRQIADTVREVADNHRLFR